MINLWKLPVDCSVETLFPNAEELMKYPADAYALQSAGELGHFKKEVWAVAYDPAEDNEVVGGIVQHDNYICLCKWLDGSPVAIRFSKRNVCLSPDVEPI